MIVDNISCFAATWTSDSNRDIKLQHVTKRACVLQINSQVSEISIVITKEDYQDFRCQIAHALDLIVPEDASEPAHVLKTLEK